MISSFVSASLDRVVAIIIHHDVISTVRCVYHERISKRRRCGMYPWFMDVWHAIVRSWFDHCFKCTIDHARIVHSESFGPMSTSWFMVVWCFLVRWWSCAFRCRPLRTAVRYSWLPDTCPRLRFKHTGSSSQIFPDSSRRNLRGSWSKHVVTWRLRNVELCI